MAPFVYKLVVSGLLIAPASTLAKRDPGIGALMASLPLVSVLGMTWLQPRFGLPCLSTCRSVYMFT